MREAGWEIATPGTLYFRFADDREVTCGYWDCVGVFVQSHNGCPGGVYVEASIEDNGVVVGTANAVIGALQPMQSGSAVLENIRGSGGTFRITEVQCM